jgi:hypothetical protein
MLKRPLPVKSWSACPTDVLPLLLAPTKIEMSEARSITTFRNRLKFRTASFFKCILTP